MKTKFSKILSSLLILSFLISMFSVFSFAENSEGGDEEGENDYTLFVHRTYDEGWGPANGMSIVYKGNKIFVLLHNILFLRTSAGFTLQPAVFGQRLIYF